MSRPYLKIDIEDFPQETVESNNIKYTKILEQVFRYYGYNMNLFNNRNIPLDKRKKFSRHSVEVFIFTSNGLERGYYNRDSKKWEGFKGKLLIDKFIMNPEDIDWTEDFERLILSYFAGFETSESLSKKLYRIFCLNCYKRVQGDTTHSDS